MVMLQYIYNQEYHIAGGYIMSEKEKLEILEQLLIEDEHEEINRLSSEANDCKYKRSSELFNK